MKHHRRKLVALMVFVALGAFHGPVFGWEFNLSGSAGYVYQYYSQQGKNGFFGSYDVDLGATTGKNFAPANGWLGAQVGNIVSGSDASTSSTSTVLFPQIRVNPALTLQGVYRIGNAPTDSFPGAATTFAFGEWLQWFVTVNTPWGLVAYGKRPFYHGNGLQFDSSNRTQEHLALVTYYGPFSIGLGFYPWRTVPDLTEPTVFAATIPWNASDKNSISTNDLYAFIDYAQGPLDVGIAALTYQHHVGPELAPSFAAVRANMAPMDASVHEGSIYMKYNNGRFFFNAEADWYYSTARFQKSFTGAFLASDAATVLAEPGDGSGDLFRPRYTEWWRAMVEFGAICGPAKLSLLWSWIPGPDRRHGVLIDKQPVLVDLYAPGTAATPNQGNIFFSQDHSNNTVFRPYSLIFNTDYGSGLGMTDTITGVSRNLVGRSNDGYIADANVYAARLDYALASNLNVFGSFLYATRVSHGYGWGFIKPAGVPGAITGAINFTPTGTFATPSPAIPDNSLGWEVDAGLNWNLLENWMLDVTAGYWQPGKWFNYACISKAVPGWDVPTAANNFGVSPDRSIGPVVAFVTRLTVGF